MNFTAPTSSMRHERAENLHLLLVGIDGHDARTLQARMLAMDGIPNLVTWRTSVAAALEVLSEMRFDTVLVDLDPDGIIDVAAVEEILRLAGESAVVVVAGADDERITAALRAGAHDFLIRDELASSSLQRTLRRGWEHKLATIERRLLFRLPTLISETQDTATGLTLALAEICRSAGWRFGEAWTPGEDGRLRRRASWAGAVTDREAFEAASRDASFPPGEGLPGRTWQSIAPLWIEDITHADFCSRRLPARRAGFRTAVGVPVRRGGRTLAALVFYADSVRDRDSGFDDLLQAVAGQLGLLLETHRAGEELRAEHSRLMSVADTIAEGVLIVDQTGRIVFANSESARMLGIPAGEMIGRELSEFDDMLRTPDGAALDPEGAPIARALQTGRPVRDAIVGILAEAGELVLLSVNAVPHVNPTGVIDRIVVSFRDITARERAERALRRSEERFARAFQANPLGKAIIQIDDRRFLEVNAGLESLLGLPRERIVGARLEELEIDIEHEHLKAFEGALDENGHVRGLPIALRSASGELREAVLFAEPIEGNEAPCLLVVAHDVTERRKIERELQAMEHRDRLTGLTNRKAFDILLNDAFEAGQGWARSLAVLFLDLDRFQVVNDALGHTAGDEVLASVARRLESCLRSREIAARIGGDEFAVLLGDCDDPAEAMHAANRIIETFELGFAANGSTVPLTPSIGVAFWTPEIERAEDMLRFAGVAMQRAKQAGGAGYRIYDPAVDFDVTRRLGRECALREAVQADEIEVRYQPVVSLETGRIVGAEALAAWTHPEDGPVSPAEFIPLAEETGLIKPLGGNVLRRVASKVGRWREIAFLSEEFPFRVSVNISPLQMSCPKLPREITRILDDAGVTPDHIVFELTEGVLIRNPECTEELRKLGVKIAVDDFGTGYASLEYLTRIKIDRLKLDRVFVDGLERDEAKSAIVESVRLMSRRLGVPVLAEGIETEEQLRILRDLGYTWGQGFYLGRPMPADEFEALLRAEPKW